MGMGARFLLLRKRGVTILKFLRSFATYFGTWPGQELTGLVSLADNVAVPLGRDVLYPKNLTVSWGEVSSTIDDADTFTTAGAGGVSLFGLLGVGKTYNTRLKGTSTASELSLRNFNNSETYGTIPVVGGVYDTTIGLTASLSGIYLRNSDAGTTDIDWSNSYIKQTDILDSSAYPGAELYVTPNAASDPAGNEANATTGWTSTSSTLTSDSSIKAVGDYSLKYIATSVAGRIFDDLNTILTVGKRYKLTLDTRHIGSGGENRISLAATDAGVDHNLIQLNNTETTFQSVVYEFTHSATTRYISCKEVNAGNDGGLYLDNISITEANPLNGDYTGVSLAQPGAGRIPYFVGFGGAGDVWDVLNTEHNSAFNPLSFEIIIYGNDFTWDANERYLLHYYVDANNYISIIDTTTPGTIDVIYKEEGQAEVVQSILTGSPTGLFSVGGGNESNVFQATYSGAQVGANQATTGSFVGNFTIMTFGAKNTTPTNVILGSLAYPCEFTALLTAGERLQNKAAFGVS